ncbi:MAG TPA: ABC transporter substrate binding protein [Gammaproteobacteria bacterium]
MLFRFSLLALLSLTLYGCSSVVTKDAEPTPPVAVPEQPAPVIVEKPLPPPPPPPRVAILLSSDIAAYRSVAEELLARLEGRAELYSLGGKPGNNKRITEAIRESGREQVVAIGMRAAVTARALADRQVLFCQVFNYREHQLIGPNSKGVSLLPDPGKSFAAWKALAPNLSDVGVVSGPGLEAMLARAAEAAIREGIRLHPVTAANDKEFQYAYKQMAGEVQGYWLLPDNRVLSRRVLREVMNFSVRHDKQVLVFSDELLGLGGLLSATSDPRDIAGRVLDRLAQAAHKETIPGADVVPLDEVTVTINAVMARRMNLRIPEQYGVYAGEPAN